MQITPFIVGSGRAAHAIERALAILNLSGEKFAIQPAIFVKRDEKLAPLLERADTPHKILCIANPSGLHAARILEGDSCGLSLIVVEKPAAVTLKDVALLKKIKAPAAVCHVYRQMWGPQTLKEMISAGEFGDLISVEGRYWQASAAQRALGETKGGGWKNDPRLSGDGDALLDIGVHWIDAALFLGGQYQAQDVKGSHIWRSFANAESAHRDTHVHLAIEFNSGVRAQASISKTMHGASNHFELNVLGTKASAAWNFLSPDQITLGRGGDSKLIYRRDSTLGSKQSPFHAMGWIEGYIEIFRQSLRMAAGEKFTPFPTLEEHLHMLESVALRHLL